MSLFSKRKKLLAIGCSYTDNWWTREHGFSVWPELLAEKLDMECFNLGKNGRGNDYIFGMMYDQIHKEKWDLVVLMWSEVQRMDFQCFDSGWLSLHPHRKNHSEKYQCSDASKISLLRYNNIPHAAKHFLRLIHMSQNVLKDIPYFMLQGCRPACSPTGLGFNHSDDYYKIVEQNFVKEMFRSPFIDKIDEDKFLGFPMMEQIGGWCVCSKFDELDPEREVYRVNGKIDTHPNKKGHEYISEILHDKYKEIYL